MIMRKCKKEVNQILSKGLCGCKQSYETEEDATIALSTKMRSSYKTADWRCFKVYRCKKCDGWHITKHLYNERRWEKWNQEK